MKARVSRGTLLFTTFMLVIAALVAVIVIVDKGSGLNYTVVFDDARGLPVGAAVKLNGVQVGEVTAIRFSDEAAGAVEVDLRVYGEHAKRIHGQGDTTARIKKDSMVLGKSYVEVFNRGAANGPELAAGSKIEGLDSWAEEQLWKGKGTADDAFAKAMETGKQSFDKLQGWVETDGAALKGDVEGFLASVEEAASERTAGARDKVDDAVERGRQLYTRLKEERAPELAEQVRAQFSALKEAGRSWEDGARAKIDSFLQETSGEEHPNPEPTPVMYNDDAPQPVPTEPASEQ